MKRTNHLIESISELDNLRLAFWKASRGKRHSREVLNYQKDLDVNLLHLQGQIQSGLVEVGDYRYFQVFDPKEREICASAFCEQVLHHGIMNICHDYFDRTQIYDSYASRKGKGTYAAIDRAKIYTRRYAWYLKLDIRKFFGSIHHDVLKSSLGRLYKDWRLLEIFDKIIESYETSRGRGLPIGNLSSQYFANHYLVRLDHYIKEQLQIKAYVRYMDDMILWHQDKIVLKKAFQNIKDYIESLLLCELKPAALNRTQRGLPFLGYLIYPYQVRLSQRSKRRFIRKIHILEQQYESGEWAEAVCQRRVLPLLAFISHADTKRFRENLILQKEGASS